MVMRILEFCMKNGIKVITVKDNYELVDNIQSKVLAFAFSIAAEIGRNRLVCKRGKIMNKAEKIYFTVTEIRRLKNKLKKDDLEIEQYKKRIEMIEQLKNITFGEIDKLNKTLKRLEGKGGQGIEIKIND